MTTPYNDIKASGYINAMDHRSPFQRAKDEIRAEREALHMRLELEADRRALEDYKVFGESLLSNPRARWKYGGGDPYIIPTEEEAAAKLAEDEDKRKTARTALRWKGIKASVFSASGVALLLGILQYVVMPLITTLGG